jgi:hypothetical protein
MWPATRAGRSEKKIVFVPTPTNVSFPSAILTPSALWTNSICTVSSAADNSAVDSWAAPAAAIAGRARRIVRLEHFLITSTSRLSLHELRTLTLLCTDKT